jgi:hypothetical protein
VWNVIRLYTLFDHLHGDTAVLGKRDMVNLLTRKFLQFGTALGCSVIRGKTATVF